MSGSSKTRGALSIVNSWVAWATVLRCPWSSKTNRHGQPSTLAHATRSLCRSRVSSAHGLRAIALSLALLTFLFSPANAAEKADDKKVDPKITCVAPFALTPGVTKSVKIRGLALADASAIKLTDSAGAAIAATIKSKGKSEAPKPYEAPRAGDCELQVELKIAADAKPGELSLIIVTPAGETKPFSLTVIDPQNAIAEKEPNNGFKTAQEIPLGKALVGAIQDNSDVDVFRIGGKAGTKIVAEIIADRRGSLLDGSLMLYDASGHILSSVDDSEGSRDPILRATLPFDGVYYLSLTDANDHGSSAHAYVLTVREDK